MRLIWASAAAARLYLPDFEMRLPETRMWGKGLTELLIYCYLTKVVIYDVAYCSEFLLGQLGLRACQTTASQPAWLRQT